MKNEIPELTSSLLTARGITKRYGATMALTGADFALQSGEVHALLGANGSGKSTLSKVIAGAVAPDEGSVELGGATRVFRSPLEARAAGVAVVYQELSLVPDMSVEDNIWLGHELAQYGRVRARETRQRTLGLLAKLEGVVSAGVTPTALVSSLAPDERQLVEFLKAVSLEPKLLILDEATASLDAKQVDRLFELVRDLKANGLGIVIVTHRMAEIERVADRVTVLRNGHVVGHSRLAETSREALVQLITGEALGALREERAQVVPSQPANTVPRLEVNIARAGRLRDVRVTLHAGEILGVGGLQGQGQSELLLALFGASPLETGEVRLEGNAVHFRHPRDAMRCGVAYVPGDRNREGLLASRSIFENMLLPAWDAHDGVTGLKVAQARDAALEMGRRLKLKFGGLDDLITSLSGGNAQKVVIGKWLLRNPRVLLLDDPTKGIDVGAKAEFYHLLAVLRAGGMSVLFNSSDEDELLSLCDRVIVMLEGRIATELDGADLTRANLIRASLGAGHSENMVSA
jgi:ribose transport system ATP-binding protein